RADLSMDEVKKHSLRLSLATTATGHADGFAALAVGTALLLGLVAARRGEGGQVLSTSMLSTMAHALAEDMVEYDGRPDTPAPDPGLLGLGARYRLYRAAEGWVFLAAPAESEWAALADALSGHVDVAGDPRFVTEADRRRHDADLAAVLEGVFARQGAAEWERQLRPLDVGCVEVRGGRPDDLLLDDDFSRASGFVADVDHPVLGRHPRMAPTVRFSRSATTVKPACLLGQHTRAVLAEIGYDDDRIDDLARRGLIKLA
ncbi:MAG TPA: CoA transferase, partial [Acidimicrobiales bacterium]|nr:CoA transferase [Acidimicrobiales bacterium]